MAFFILDIPVLDIIRCPAQNSTLTFTPSKKGEEKYYYEVEL